MRILRIASLLFVALLAHGVAWAAEDDIDLPPAVLQRCKKATALVDLGRDGSGSAFLVHASGLFVTNAHVVAEVPPGTTVKLILNSGDADQKIVTARPVFVSEEDDLALLKTDDPVTAEPLTLSDDANLVELAKAVVFGYPFGTMLASGSEPYPSISINVGRLSALRRNGPALDKIQLDAATNPGNSGGPLIDKEGKVIGIIVSSIRGANVNFAIPSTKLIPLLQKPVLSLHTPRIAYTRRSEAREFEVEVIPLIPVPPDAEINVHFGEGAPSDRTSFKATQRDGRYYVKGAPYDQGDTPAPLRLRVKAKYGIFTLAANFDDCPVRIGDRTLQLSEIRSVRKESDAEKTTTTIKTTLVRYDEDREAYETVKGPIAGLPALPSKINQVVVKLEDAETLAVGAYDPGATSVPYEITLSSKGQPVATSRGRITFADPPHGLSSEIDAVPRTDEDSKPTPRRNDTLMSGEGIRVDTLINPEKDVKQGTWTLTKNPKTDYTTLETKAEENAWCEIPVLPTADYAMQIRFAPKQADNGELLLRLPVGKSSALLHIGGEKSTMTIDLAESKGRNGENSAPIAPLAADKTSEVRLLVRTSGQQAQVVVWCGEGRPLAWTGPIQNLAPVPKEVPVAADRIGLGHHNLEMSMAYVRVETGDSSLRVLREIDGVIMRALPPMLGKWSFDTAPADGKIPSLITGATATVVGAPRIGVGPAVLGTGAMKLDGDAGAGIFIPETGVRYGSLLLQRTLSMWFRADAAVPPDQRQYLYDEGTIEKGIAVYLEGGRIYAGAWDMKAERKETWFNAPDIAPEKWYHIGLILDGKSEDEKKETAFQFYLNGAQVGAGLGQAIGNQSIAVGTLAKSSRSCPDSPANPTATNHPFIGLIDEVVIYNTVLHPGALALLAGGRYGIGQANDRAVSAPPAPPLAKADPAAPPAPTPAVATVTSIDRSNPAVVTVPGLGPNPLVESPDKTAGSWERVPEGLRNATAYTKTTKGKQATGEFTVTKAGRVYLACNYAYEGNPSGDWQSKVWKREDFLKDGWTEVLLDLKKWGNSNITIFTKVLPEGTTLHLRCNKYSPPIVITF